MEQRLPLVTIVITAYNRQHHIAEAINSALAQDYKNLEIIVSDNASTDDTDRIISGFTSDPRIKYFRQEQNIGMTANFKFASSKATGEFITYLSSDDYFINSSFISQGVALINQYENITAVLGTFNSKIENTGQEQVNVGGTFEQEFYEGEKLFFLFPKLKAISFAAALMNTRKVLEMSPFDKPCSAFDVLILLKLMLQGNVATLNVPSYLLRLHGKNLSTVISVQQAIDNMIYITEPYEEALQKGFAKSELDEWKNESAFLYARYITVQFAPQSAGDYRIFMDHLKKNFPAVITKLKKDLRWHVLTFFFKRPAFGLFWLKNLSKPHYNYLKTLIEVGEKKSSYKTEI